MELLLYNLPQAKAGSISRLCASMGVSIRQIPKDDYLQPIGVLASLPGFTRTPLQYNGPTFADEMMLFCGFDDAQLHLFLNRYRQAGIEPIPLKAGLTPNNIFWNSLQLHEELEKEHRALGSNE